MKTPALLLGGLLLTFALSAQELRFVVGEWTPYTGSGLAGGGVAVELVEAACLEAGLEARVDFVPWKRAEAMVESGQAFASFPYLRLAVRGDRFLYSDPFLTTRFVVLAKNKAVADQVNPRRPETFHGLRVGLTAGTAAVRSKLEPVGALLEETPALEASIRKLEAGRLDLVVDDQVVVAQTLKALYGKQIPTSFVLLDRPFGDPGALRILVSRDWPGAEALLGELNRGLARVLADGTAARLWARWGLTPP